MMVIVHTERGIVAILTGLVRATRCFLVMMCDYGYLTGFEAVEVGMGNKRPTLLEPTCGKSGQDKSDPSEQLQNERTR